MENLTCKNAPKKCKNHFKIIGSFGDKKIALTKEGAAAIEKEMDEYCIPCSKMVACSPPATTVEIYSRFYLQIQA